MSQDYRHPQKVDPYRVVKKNGSQDEYHEEPSLQSQLVHSRTSSESSTSHLANSNISKQKEHFNSEMEDVYEAQDPYAPRSEKKKKKKKQPKISQDPYYEQEKRANSYLPYSNHKRNQYHTESIQLEEDNYNSPHTNQRGHIGSILQDNINMDMIHDQHHEAFYQDGNDYIKKQNTNSALIQTLPPVKKKRWWAKLGVTGIQLLFIVFISIGIIGIIWFFVWPRVPTLQFIEATLANDEDAIYTSTSMIATWNVSFSVINTDNWVPTLIKNLAVNVIEETTGVTFGYGNSGRLTLAGRSIEQIINIPIKINFERDANDLTLKTLLSVCRIINSDYTSTIPKQTLHIKFNIVYHIAGIVWQSTASVAPQSYFQCP